MIQIAKISLYPHLCNIPKLWQSSIIWLQAWICGWCLKGEAIRKSKMTGIKDLPRILW